MTTSGADDLGILTRGLGTLDPSLRPDIIAAAVVLREVWLADRPKTLEQASATDDLGLGHLFTD